MKNALKLRIIHHIKDNAEAEYLIEFFRFIGCLVHDELIASTLQYSLLNEWDKHLKTINEPQGVDIVLNYYHVDLYKFECNIRNTERIYIYFSLEDKICTVSEKTLLPDYVDTYSSKKTTRHLALRFLVDAIWKNDPININAIQLIRAYYTYTNGKGDLFYILQELKCFSILATPELVKLYYDKEEGDKQEKWRNEELKARGIIQQPIHSYTEKMFSSLFEIQSLLQGENPYILYTRINTSLQILKLSQFVNAYDKRGNAYRISIDKLLQEATALISNNVWFVTANKLLADIYMRKQRVVAFINCHRKIQSSYISFSYYYTSSMLEEGRLLQVKGNIEDALKIYKRAVKNTSRESGKAKLWIAQILASEGKFKEAESYIENIAWNFDSFIDSFSSIILNYRVQLLMSKISIRSNREYSVKAYVRNMFQNVREYEKAKIVNKVADNSEAEFQQFMKFHQKSMSMRVLLKVLEEWSDKKLTALEEINQYAKYQLY